MSVQCEMLLHPELLSNDQLRAVLLERHLRIPNIPSMPRDQLLQLFHHFCVPYGQRKYRDSGRGKMLNKIRNIQEEVPSNLTIDCQGSKRKARQDTHESERLKPPPDLLSGHIKRIKISFEVDRKECPSNIDTHIKRKITKDKITSTEGSPRKKERKLVTWP